jgi:hypothetical protein
LFIEGMLGKFIFVIPLTVITALTMSMLESYFLLPAHLLTGLRGGEQQKVGRGWFHPMSRYGLNVSALSQAVKTTYQGSEATSTRYGDEDVQFTVILEEEYRKNLDYLKRLQISNGKGELINLEEVADFTVQAGARAIYHEDGEPTTTLSGDVDEESITALEVMELVEEHFSFDVMRQYPGVRLDIGGEAAESQQAIRDILLSFALAAVGIYFLLMLLFNSLTQPFVVWSREQSLFALAHQYNGYRFCEDDVRVYNPFSILHAFNKLKLRDFWFETATPSFLINLLKEQRYSLPTLEGLEVSEAMFATFDLDRLRPEALLFQTGYLTISDVQQRLYTLDYPNLEVKRAFSESLFFSFAEGANGSISSHVLKLSRYLEKKNFDAFFETMQAVFASIPYTLNTQRDEAYFHTIFYLMLSASGVEADCEMLTSEGRIDLAVEFSDTVYIPEFKCNQSPEAAIQQIRDKHYADKYQQKGKQIVLIGINFDTETRNVAEWKIA